MAAEAVEGGIKLTDVGEGLGVFDLDTVYKSVSAAGSAVMGGIACNGWRFWSVQDGEVLQPEGSEVPERTEKPKNAKLLRKVPNQQGVPEGSIRFFCNACMKSHVVEGATVPVACPEGHGAEE